MSRLISGAGTVEAVRQHSWRLLIDGALVEAIGGEYFDAVDPATEEILARVPDAGPADVDRAVAAAERAFASWRETTPRERGRIVRRLADVLRAHAAELAQLDALDAGLPIANVRNDVAWAAELLELFADSSAALKGETVPASAQNLHYTLREPFGVVGRIVPFNHPIFFAAGKIAAPLVAGNTVVLKPAEQTALSALRMAELFASELPAGVLNVVCGEGPAAGQALVRHPTVRRLAFIGSDTVGRAIQRDAAEVTVKDITLELGGKNAMIVLPDADTARTARGAVAGMNFVGSQGQSCGSNSRLLVHAAVEEELVAAIVALVRDLRIGSPLDDRTQMGPLVSAGQRARTEQYVAAGIDEGAKLRTGGMRPAGFSHGFFHEPTVFSGVTPTMRMAREEIFGPVLSVMSFQDLHEAIEIANGVDLGLTASVWTNDVRIAHRTARALEAGYVWINGSSRHFWGTPFGGIKSSGVGREECLEELLSFTQSKAVHVLLEDD